MKYFTNIFLHVENSARQAFEKFPFTHAFFAGVGVILLWRGVWMLADKLQVSPFLSIGMGIIILVGIGLFVQTFVGNAIIIKSVENEKKFEQRTKRTVSKVKRELRADETTLNRLAEKLEIIEAKVDSLFIKDSHKT